MPQLQRAKTMESSLNGVGKAGSLQPAGLLTLQNHGWIKFVDRFIISERRRLIGL